MKRAKRNLDFRDIVVALCCGLVGALFVTTYGLVFAIALSSFLVVALTLTDRTL